MKHTGMIFNVIILALIALIIVSHREGFTSEELRKIYIDSKAPVYATADGTANGTKFCELMKPGSKCIAGAGSTGEHMGLFTDCETVVGMKASSLISYKCA
jgi:acyl-coenzyme A synthetase/AMP-(fatty) acid ligase